MCKPQGLPKMAIGPGCAKRNGGTNVIYVMHVPRNGDRIVNHNDVLAQWGMSSDTLAAGGTDVPPSSVVSCALYLMTQLISE